MKIVYEKYGCNSVQPQTKVLFYRDYLERVLRPWSDVLRSSGSL